MKDNFLLKTSQISVFNELSNEDAGKLIKGIFEYAQSDKIILDGYLRVIFIPIKEEIDKNQERYEKRCEANRENGKRGGRPKKAKETQENPSVILETQKTLTRHNHNHNHNQLNNINNNNIFSYIEENFGRLLTPIEYQEISSWEDNELTRYAIKEAVLNGKYNIKYIARILENYKKNSIITIQQAQEEQEKFKNKNKKNVPMWLNEEIKEESLLTDEEREWLKSIE